MRSHVLPVRYFLILLLIIGAMIVAEFLTAETMAQNFTLVIKSPFANTFVEKIFNTLFIAVFILILYTIGVYLLVRKIPDEASRFTATRIFIVIMLALGLLLILMEWVQEPAQIVLVLGIIWGALVVALRDLIQNMVGSLTLLVTRMYRIGDRIQIKGVYGLVMDIGFFRTVLMQLDRESGDHPGGEIITIPNGILFRELITNTSRDLSISGDEIRITLPFTADLQNARKVLLDVVHRHTGGIQAQAAREIEELGHKKYLPPIETKPTIYLHMDDYQVLMVLKYFTSSSRRSLIKSEIVEEISRLIPGITKIDQ
ncbi:MAG: mechanosensitive ion channel family protein [Methanoregulaceae archaeon]|jgi:small-conductance mechanosensitive channel|nr:mechanosensitive ion channel family protein [Methanoregulaceae archaeon]